VAWGRKGASPLNNKNGDLLRVLGNVEYNRDAKKFERWLRNHNVNTFNYCKVATLQDVKRKIEVPCRCFASSDTKSVTMICGSFSTLD
jgi:hypothetical protein